MSKKLAAVSAALVLLCAALCAAPYIAKAAADANSPVTFGGVEQSPLLIMPLHAAGIGGVLYVSPVSNSFTHSYDTALIDGSGSGSKLIFEISKQLEDKTWSPWISAEIHSYQNGSFWGSASLPDGTGALRLRIIDGGIKAEAQIVVSGMEVHDSHSSDESLSAATLDLSPVEMRGNILLAYNGSEASLQQFALAARVARVRASAEIPPFPAPALPSFVHTRKEWNAEPTRNPYVPMAPWRITIHHTAEIQTMNLQDTLKEMRFIQDFQQNGRGWDDIAYHFLIDGAGNIIEGRPVNAVGAHAQGFNDGNIGIALMGYFSQPANDHITQAQLNALIKLLDYLVPTYQIDLSEIKGHRDYDGTNCPGDNIYPLLPSILKKISAHATAKKPKAFKLPAGILPSNNTPQKIPWDGLPTP